MLSNIFHRLFWIRRHSTYMEEYCTITIAVEPSKEVGKFLNENTWYNNMFGKDH